MTARSFALKSSPDRIYHEVDVISVIGMALLRLQTFRDPDRLLTTLDPSLTRRGCISMLCTPDLSVEFAASEAEMLVSRLEERRTAEGGSWRPTDQEIVGYACGLPSARSSWHTERYLLKEQILQPKQPLGPDDVTEQDKINMRKR
jgi:hypothetical protein